MGSMGTALRLTTVRGTPRSKQKLYTAAAASGSKTLLIDVSGCHAPVLVLSSSPPITETSLVRAMKRSGSEAIRSATSRSDEMQTNVSDLPLAMCSTLRSSCAPSNSLPGSTRSQPSSAYSCACAL
jgi:hypothetical protein